MPCSGEHERTYACLEADPGAVLSRRLQLPRDPAEVRLQRSSKRTDKDQDPRSARAACCPYDKVDAGQNVN